MLWGWKCRNGRQAGREDYLRYWYRYVQYTHEYRVYCYVVVLLARVVSPHRLRQENNVCTSVRDLVRTGKGEVDRATRFAPTWV